MPVQKSLDDLAAEAANRMLKSDSMPDSQKESNGGLSTEGEEMTTKSGKTGEEVSNQPGHEGPAGKTGTAITSAPKSKDGSGAGEPSQLPTDADDAMRAKKAKSMAKAAPPLPKPPKAEAENEDDEDEDDEAEKGGIIDADDLIKSLETLEAVAKGSSVPAPEEKRKDLAAKLAAGTLSKSEMVELSQLMEKAGDVAEPVVADDLSKSFSETFTEDSELQKGFDVSPFLERHASLTAEALDRIQTTFSKSLDGVSERSKAFNEQLAKSLSGIGKIVVSQDKLIKSLVKRLDTVESAPLPRKSFTGVGVLHKSLEGEAGAAVATQEQLSKSEVLDTLEEMMKSNVGMLGGQRIDYVIAQAESTSEIPRNVLTAVQQFRAKQRRA